MTARPSTSPNVDIDDEVEICRDEDCKLLGIHAKHEVKILRGRPPKLCPTCREPLTIIHTTDVIIRRCELCNYHRP